MTEQEYDNLILETKAAILRRIQECLNAINGVSAQDISMLANVVARLDDGSDDSQSMPPFPFFGLNK